MSSSQNKRLKQLKFISNIFNLSLKEIQDTLGFETLTMIFRRVGETAAEGVFNHLKGNYNSLEDFCKLLIEEVVTPIIGENMGTFEIQGDKVTINLKACPYKKAGGFPIKDMGFFCHYTEGLFDNAFKLAYPDKKIETIPCELQANGCKNCVYDFQIN